MTLLERKRSDMDEGAWRQLIEDQVQIRWGQDGQEGAESKGLTAGEESFLDDLSKQVNAGSSHHFLRLFKRAFSQRPHTYLTRQRLLLVRDLLLRSEESVTAACYRVRFACSLVVLSVFCRAARQQSPMR
jgi:AraC-like DNA-binding protein